MSSGELGVCYKSMKLRPCLAPFSPPRRSSSLAFRANRRTQEDLQKQLDASTPQVVDLVNQPQSNIGRNRFGASPPNHDPPSSPHVVQMRRIFHNAKASFLQDMAAASSPASSIAARLTTELPSPADNLSIEQTTEEVHEVNAEQKTWRYSTAPMNLAATTVDVREPLPSPTLPDLSLEPASPGHEGIEPVSSGFTSPHMRQSFNCIYEAMTTALPSSSDDEFEDAADDPNPSTNTAMASSIVETELEKPLTQLRVSSDDLEGESPEESPVVRHLKRRSYGTAVELEVPSSPERAIFLSATAEAAANSAKAKRKLLKRTLDNQHGDQENQLATNGYGSLRPGVRCPDPAVHRLSTASPCPNPSLHGSSPSMMRRPHSAMSSDMVMIGQGPHYGPVPGPFRATATGSPMPFARTRARPSTADGYRYPQQMLAKPHMQEQMNTFHEHFTPGWYYAQEPVRPRARPALRPQYSFSTAASRVVGADQAPDSRIRDSYKTDTLTALAKPPSKYRKNGIGAEVAARGVGRYYQRPPSSLRPPSARSRPSSRRTYVSGEDVRFRSSPPRAPASEHYLGSGRKRAMNDAFVAAEAVEVPEIEPVLRLQRSDDVMEIDEQTKAAVRMSIFGTSTPEALHKAREGLKELSPNVQVFRKHSEEHTHLRKKRRPSYWDNDLKEVRESPAGRGGVNSPVSAKESMRAEFEIASLRNTEMDLDENDLSEEVVQGDMNPEQRLNVFKHEM